MDAPIKVFESDIRTFICFKSEIDLFATNINYTTNYGKLCKSYQFGSIYARSHFSIRSASTSKCKMSGLLFRVIAKLLRMAE